MKKLFLFAFLLVAISSYGQTITKDMPAIKEGDKAPDITGIDTTSAIIHLSGIDSKFTLVYFYDFGCAHCDSMLPVLIKLYDNYKKSGLEIFAVPFVGTKDQWLKLIQKNHLTWINVFLNDAELSSIRKNYKLYATPTLYLLDSKKRVLSKPMRTKQDVENIFKKYF